MYSRYLVINFIFILYNQLEFNSSEYNLYFTEQNSFDYDCFDDSFDSFRHHKEGLVSFCIRYEIFKNNNLCYGKELTFKELKINNITTIDLFYWNAVLDIIDLYEKYISTINLVNDNEIYCNCSHLFRFGKFCQYEIYQHYDKRIFSQLLDFHDNINPEEEEFNIHFTCYIGISCQTNLFCLDWRQICNGIIDCDYGEDEPAELCLQMESNDCDIEKEFRCKSGLCLPLSLAYDLKENCPDRSNKMKVLDENLSNYWLELCLQYPSMICDETNYGWKKFSCNNGQYIFYSDLILKKSKLGHTCINNRHRMYLKRLFSNINQEDQCWQALICLTDFNYLFSHINCLSNELIIENINKYCSNEFYFPSNSIVYSYVFFFYDKINHNTWFNYSGPDYICYKKEYCLNNPWILPTIFKNNLVCFHVNQQIFTWKNFYEYIIHIFSLCYNQSSNINLKINNKLLFECNSSQTWISIYRVKDKIQDCFYNEDENENIDLCLLKTNDLFQCFTNQNQCIRRTSLNDKQYDCLDGSDEYFDIQTYILCENSICEIHPWKKRNPDEIYRFTELCDNIVNYHLFTKQSNETDETDCEYWLYSCDSIYTKCDQIWNCYDGRDEINCSQYGFINEKLRSAFNCQNNEHYCLQLINYTYINTTCINMNRIHNGIIDCIGGTDERLTSICLEKYPIDYKRRFHCMNSSECIRPDEVCDRKIDCPFEDDERICPWLIENNTSIFYCNNAPFYSVNRCQKTDWNTHRCLMNEQFWFCDLEMISSKVDKSELVSYEIFPSELKQKIFDTNQMIITSKKTTRLLTTIIDNYKWLCNFGLRIQSSIIFNRSYCFCPPTYYGEYCQYQSEHLVVVLKTTIRYFMKPSTVFRLVAYLLNETNFIISFDEIIFNHIFSFDLLRFYLIYEKIEQLPLQQRIQSKFVRIDSYIINETNVQYISSWKFSVLFPFLPVNKLVVEISLVDQLFRFSNCRKRCSSHGKCMYYLNIRDREYCWCDQGWYGETCQIKSSLLNLCAHHSQYIILNNQTKCLCPLGKSGSQCYITYNSCTNVYCKNNGTCLPIKEPSIESRCVCQIGYKGQYCEFLSFPTNVSIDTNLIDQSLIPAIIVILGSIMKNTLIQNLRFLHDNITLPLTIQIRTPMLLQFSFIRIFYNFSVNFYYAIIIQDSIGLQPHMNTSVLSKNRCQNVSELFNQTILYNYSYLKRLKLYHLPCYNNKNLRCFYDEYRMCICTREHKSSCYIFSHDYNSCNYCQNNGICFKSNINSDYWKFVCICQECSFGNLCQFSLKNYYITLDTLVGIDIKIGNNSFIEQSSIIHLILAILIIIILFSLIFNIISIIIFSNKKLRQVGCDLYLLNITILSQIGLFILFLRYLYMIFIQIFIIENQLFIEISCLILEYLVRLIPSIFDWLTVCISIERTYMIIKDVHFTKITALKTLKLAKWIILIVILGNILTTLHRPFYLNLVDEINITGEPQGHPWCVLDFQLTLWNTYEKIINLFHLCLPLIFNLISLMFFILRKTQSEFTSTVRKDKRTRFSILIEQLVKYKPLLISTIIVILLEIPRFILIFILSCFKQTWQRYIYLVGYLISFLPLCCILFIYILPSPKHNQQLKLILKKIFYSNSSQKIKT